MLGSFLRDAVSAAVAGLLAALAALGTPATAPGHGEVGLPPPGRDVGWPNCPPGLGIPERRTLGKPMPPARVRFVVVGLTNGPAFTPNPCLHEQVATLRARQQWTSAYAVVTHPTPPQLRRYGAAGPRAGTGRLDRLWNTGWAQARQNLTLLRSSGLRTPTIWLDVEPVPPPAPWSEDPAANRAVLAGSMAAYRRAGLSLGVYSTPSLWRSVLGEVAYGLPEWRAAGPTSRRAAARLCTGPSIQGGEPVLAQWTDGEVDDNLLCPGRPPGRLLARHFGPPPN